jgi:ABC-type taurine transport system ATPase subunit
MSIRVPLDSSETVTAVGASGTLEVEMVNVIEGLVGPVPN